MSSRRLSRTVVASRSRGSSAAGPSRHRVMTLVYDGLATFEFGIAVEFFGLARPEFDEWYDFGLVSVDPGPVRAAGGFLLSGAQGLSALRQADTIVIPGWRGVTSPVPENLIRALVRAHERGARLMSFCSGAFVLAATGLLQGRRITTHWRYAEAMARMHPDITVDADVLYVDEGSLLTSAGSAAAVDLCLHVVRKDFGPRRANEVARRLVVPPHRDGGQSQFIQKALPEADEPGKIAEVMAWARAHLGRNLNISLLAKRACMSERTFARKFREVTGTSPHRWLVHERVLMAQDLLEQTDASIDDAAERCGFGSAVTLRHHFSRVVHLSPTAYRSRFRVNS